MYTPIIGLEIHVELKTKQKMFCGCDAEHFQIEPNTHTCPVCLGLPGALPVPNKQAIEWTQLIGLALNCELVTESKFDRKHYFYPDLPKGYQISQYDQPLCVKGQVKLRSGKTIRITRAHLEEDTAKNVHQKVDGRDMTLVDFNRSSVPLVEIVTEPDFRTAEDCDEFLKSLRQILRYLGVSDCDMEKGSMRLEVNMSLAKTPSSWSSDMAESKVRTIGSQGIPDSGRDAIASGQNTDLMLQHDGTQEKLEFPNYKVEVKNINSFRYVQRAIVYELKRQTDLLDQGITPDQETRGYQEDVDRTISQRSKEEAADYRYFPEPDIPPLVFNQRHFDKIKSDLPELPFAKQKRFMEKFQLKEDMAMFLTETRKLAEYFEICVGTGHDMSLQPNQIANVIKNKKYDWQVLSPKELIDKIQSEKADVVSDESAIKAAVEKVLAANPDEVGRYKAGEQKLMGFFMGQVMKELKGKGEAGLIQKLLSQTLQK